MDQVGAEIGDQLRHAGAGIAVVDDAGHTSGPGKQTTTGIMRNLRKIAGLRRVESVLGTAEPCNLVAPGFEHPADFVIEHLCAALDGEVVMGEEDAHLLFCSPER